MLSPGEPDRCKNSRSIAFACASPPGSIPTYAVPHAAKIGLAHIHYSCSALARQWNHCVEQWTEFVPAVPPLPRARRTLPGHSPFAHRTRGRRTQLADPIMRTLPSAASLLLLAATGLAQAPGTSWTPTPTPLDPPLRRENPGTADHSHMYVFGGTTGNSGGVRVNDLWSFDGTSWVQLTADGAAGSPPARHQAGVTWDFTRNKLVVFGGQDAAGTILADTWEWDPVTNAWANITPAFSPPARRFTAISQDPATGGLVMFGGLDTAGAHLNDTWMFLGGAAWVQAAPNVVPSTRRQHHLVTRPDVGDVLLFGGQDASLTAPANWRTDTFTWNGSDWTQIVTTTNPTGLVANDATYDQLRQRVVFPSGNGATGQWNGVSEFDTLTNDWVLRPGLGYFSRFFVAYVPAVGKTFKVSGQGNLIPANTYEYQSAAIADAPAYGAGCSGSAGAMTLTADSRPWQGRAYEMTGTGFAAGSIGFAVHGFGAQSTPLASLHPAGGVGCDLLVSTDAVVLVLPTAGQAAVTLDLPAGTAFTGIVIRSQMLGIELNAALNVTMIASTNALAATIGAL